MPNESWTSEEEALLCYANSGASLDFSPNTAVKFYLQDKQMQEEWVQRCIGEAVHMLQALLMAFQVHIDLLPSAKEKRLPYSCSSEEDTAQLERAGRWARRGAHPCHEMLTCGVVPARANQPQGAAASIICTLLHGIPTLFSGLGPMRPVSANDVITCSWVRGYLLRTLQELPVCSQLGWSWLLAGLIGFLVAKVKFYLPGWILPKAKTLALIKPFSPSHTLKTHHMLSFSY